MALDDFIHEAKADAERRVNSSRKDAQRLRWIVGYHVGSLSRDHILATRSYIARQFRHHPDLVPI